MFHTGVTKGSKPQATTRLLVVRGFRVAQLVWALRAAGQISGPCLAHKDLRNWARTQRSGTGLVYLDGELTLFALTSGECSGGRAINARHSPRGVLQDTELDLTGSATAFRLKEPRHSLGTLHGPTNKRGGWWMKADEKSRGLTGQRRGV